MASDTLAVVPTSSRARTAVLDGDRSYSYAELDRIGSRIASGLLRGQDDLSEARIAFLIVPGFPYLATLWAIWRAGGVAVPLAPQHPEPEWEHVLRDSQAFRIVADGPLLDRIAPLAKRLGLPLDRYDVLSAVDLETPLPRIDPDRRALILYTSGTTGKPKGVVLTHRNLLAQVGSLVSAWQWSSEDRILHVLPLHHIHGIVNALCCPLAVGASVHFLSRFDPPSVWEAFATQPITVFMGVPTMYGRLLNAWEAADPPTRDRWSAGARRLRLTVSGSAALPIPTFQHWEEITGQRILERYGMTEIGMALSNPLDGERVPGTVGYPLPGVQVRLRGEDGSLCPDGQPGQIEVRGPTVFREYWNRPGETARAFRNGWFQTGDLAVREEGRYRILGRLSVDILKVGGYKVSALEVEHVLKGHPAVAECAVVGLPDSIWGERVAAAVVPRPGTTPTRTELRTWCKERLAAYKVPRQVLLVSELPRNAMGKVLKPKVRALFET